MNSKYKPKRHYSLKGILFFLGIAFLWHLLLLLSPQPKEAAVIDMASQNTFLFLEPKVSELQAQTLWLDPTIYLLPADFGFSSHLRKIEPQPKLTLIKTEVTDHFTGYEPSRIDEAPGDEEAEVLSALNVGPMVFEDSSKNSEKAMEAGSAWLVSSDLSKRLLSSTSALPLVVSSELIAPTIVRICVGANGIVLYAILEKPSGMETADDAALRFAKTLHFQSELNSASEWGVLKVFWHAEASSMKMSS